MGFKFIKANPVNYSCFVKMIDCTQHLVNEEGKRFVVQAQLNYYLSNRHSFEKLIANFKTNNEN